MQVAGWSAGRQTIGNELDPIVRLYHGGTNVPCTRGAVELAGAHERTALACEALGELPAVGDRNHR